MDSALRRARARLARAGPAQDDLAEPGEADRRALLDRYVDAFTRADPDALVQLLRADVELEMPPIPTWFTGQQAVTGFLAARVMRAGRWRLEPSAANTQPALIVRHHGGAGQWEPYGVQVLTLTGARVARIVSFNDRSLVRTFAPPARPTPTPPKALIADNSKKPAAAAQTADPSAETKVSPADEGRRRWGCRR